MSLILALPCAEGVLIASDSRSAVVEDLTALDTARLEDGAPKLHIVGDFAVSVTGLVARGDHPDFDPTEAARLYWSEAAYRLTPSTFEAFGEAMRDHAALVRDQFDDASRVRLAFAVVQAPESGVAVVGLVRVYADGELRVVRELVRYGPASVPSLRVLGRHVEARSIIQDRMAVRRLTARRVGGLDAPSATAFLLDVLLTAGAQDRLVGGALSITLIRPVTLASALEPAQAGGAA